VSSLFTLLDDIASLLDDVAALTKVATTKTAGVLGDDLALNAHQVMGVRPNRELAIVWSVFKGSAVNKLILVPLALTVSAFAPWVIVPALMLGGAFLCFEGFEKVVHKLLHKAEDEAHHAAHRAAVADPEADLVKMERDRIRGAIRTDVILSAEIVIIALGTVAEETLLMRSLVLSAIAAGMTIGVYGLVAAIVRIDDVGLRLVERGGASWALGRTLLTIAPLLMKFLSIAGTAAMFLVGGGILVHGIEVLHHFAEHQSWPIQTFINGGVGILAGAILVAIYTPISRLFRRKPKEAH
jgi:predicted DNA repair protein MutK